LGLIQGRGIINTLAPLLTRKGVDHQVRRADHAVLHPVAAWIASSSAINGSSSRRRNWASTSGSTKCAWEPSTWTLSIPQAYITARSVRNRLQICSSEQANSCFNNSNANKTRVETGGRPRVVALGKRWAKEWSTAATNAAHGNVSAHWRMGCVAGTKSATCRHGPRPVSQY
jgi:hypothetical protein